MPKLRPPRPYFGQGGAAHTLARGGPDLGTGPRLRRDRYMSKSGAHSWRTRPHALVTHSRRRAEQFKCLDSAYKEPKVGDMVVSWFGKPYEEFRPGHHHEGEAAKNWWIKFDADGYAHMLL